MALLPEQEARIAKNLKTLDYMEGTGVIDSQKRTLADERFLFISSGGTGHKTLKALREQLNWKVDSAELSKKVRYLAIDAAHKELDELRPDFSENELLRLPYEGAHDMINPLVMPGDMREWVDPALYDQTGGRALAAAATTGFDHTGAGAWRQPGRVRLCLPATISALQNQITAAIDSLYANAPVGTRLHVFFLAGIAGGTGSGTIIDLPFLVRQIIRGHAVSSIYTNTTINAYLTLPSGCGKPATPGDAVKGNRNAYAALKEIDYFMGLQSRGEAFRQHYGTFSVDITENIFDFCTLVEGYGGTISTDPAGTARQVTANAILNLIATTEVKANNVFLVDSFKSNNQQQINARIQQQPLWPRNANYCYSVIGYASAVIPIDLMTVYVANKVFEKVWDLFEKNKEATSKAAHTFLERCNLQPEQLKATPRFSDIENSFKAEADRAFCKKGPFFMINLTRQAMALLDEPKEYRSFARTKATSRALFNDRDGWQSVVKLYDRIERDLLLPMNNGLYAVYTEVIRQLQDLLRKNGKLLTDTQEHKSTFGSSFAWSPVDLTNGTECTQSLKSYLDGLFREEDINRIVNKFITLLCDKKDQWTNLDPDAPDGKRFNAAQEIRTFIQEEFSLCVNATMEDFLVKLWSGNPAATVPSLPEAQDPNAHIEINAAAARLFNELRNRSSALVQTQNFSLDACYRNNYITIPDGCKWLPGKITNLAASAGIPANNVFKSSARDCVAFYTLYEGVPAWAFKWTSGAELNYETAPDSVGLHMEHGENGRDWTRFPNLYCQELWVPGNDTESRRREAILMQEARDDLRRAKALDLLTHDTSVIPVYSTYILPKGKTAQELYNTPGLEDKRGDMETFLAALAGVGLAQKAVITYATMERASADPTIDANAHAWSLTEGTLRRMMNLWDNLKHTLPVADELKSMLGKELLATRRFQLFLNTLKSELLIYKDLRNAWYLEAGDEKLLCTLDTKFEQECREYYAAQAFYALDEDTIETIEDHYRELTGDSATDEQLQAIKDRSASLKKRAETVRRNKKDGSFPMASELFEKKAGKDAAAIRTFYDDMITDLF